MNISQHVVCSVLQLSALIFRALILPWVQIVEQVVSAKRYLESIGDHAPVTGVVFMGMGEPFDNYER